MKKRFLWCLFFFIVSFDVGFAAPSSLQMQDIQRVMDKFFSLHITNHEMTPLLVRRAFKIYIENFDPDRVYLLESEAMEYLQMSDTRLQAVLQRLKKGDYSDFVALNQVMQQAVIRAQAQRKGLILEFLKNPTEQGEGFFATSSQFPQTVEEVGLKQKGRMLRFFAYHQMRSRLDTAERRGKVFSLFEKRVRRMEYNYLFLTMEGEKLPKEKIEHVMSVRIVKAFAKSLDTHTAFFSPEEAYEMRLGLEKQFNGVGVVLSEGIDGIMIADLIQGSPAEKSGQIQVNDFLVEIDQKSVASSSFEEVMEILKKKGNEEIILGLKRGEETHYHVSLKKQPIVMSEERIQTAFERTKDGIIGKIILHSFYENGDGVNSARDIQHAIQSFRQHGNLVGLVLDLRENSGGFLSQAVRVAGLFVANGVVVISKYGKGEIHYLRNVAGRSFYSGPLVVLTSKMSASAAEIVAQALQDYGVALVVGDETTFGKGSIQYQTVTDPNADLFFKVTVGRYYTVSGRSTQIAGVGADIVVPSHYAPYNIGERFLEYPLTQDKVEAAYVDPLTDLDEKTKRVFQARYLPYTQKAVSFWQNMLPALRENSAQRIANNPQFQAFLKHQEVVRARRATIPVNTVDEPLRSGLNDLQMQEAVYIVLDMMEIESVSKEKALDLLPTGS